MKSSVKGKLAVGLIRLFSSLPLPLVRAFGRSIGRLLWLTNSEGRHVTETNLRHCFPDMPEAERTQLAKRSLIASSLTAAEIAAIWLRPPEKVMPLIKQVNGLEHFEAAKARGKGIIFISPHVGNWEIVGLHNSTIGKATILYAPTKLTELQEIIDTARAGLGATLVPTTTQGVRTMLKALRNNEIVNILPDQIPPDGSGTFADFYGIPALTMTLVSNLAIKTDAVILCSYSRRLPSGNDYEICVTEVDSGMYEKDEATAALALNKTMENCINSCVEQYQWNYKRFRRRPPGAASLYE